MVDVQSQDHIYNQSNNIQSKDLTTQSLSDVHAKAPTLLQTHCTNALVSALSKYADPESDEEYLEKLVDKPYDPVGHPDDPMSQMHRIGHKVEELKEVLISTLKDPITPEEKKKVIEKCANEVNELKSRLVGVFKQIAPERDADTLAKQLITRYQDLGIYEYSEDEKLPDPKPPQGVVFVDWDQTLTQGSDYKARHGGDKEFSYQDQYLAHAPNFNLSPRLTEFLIKNLTTGVVTHIVTDHTDAKGKPDVESVRGALEYALKKLGDENPKYTAKNLFDSGMIRVTYSNEKGKTIKNLIEQDPQYKKMSPDQMAFIDDRKGNVDDVSKMTKIQGYQASLNIADGSGGFKDASGITAETGLDALNHILQGKSPDVFTPRTEYQA